jgi:hypothetical protein
LPLASSVADGSSRNFLHGGSRNELSTVLLHRPPVSRAGFAKPVGTGPVRPIPGGTGPARYMNRSGSHPKPCLQIRETGKPAGLTGKPSGFFIRGNRSLAVLLTLLPSLIKTRKPRHFSAS